MELRRQYKLGQYFDIEKWKPGGLMKTDTKQKPDGNGTLRKLKKKLDRQNRK